MLQKPKQKIEATAILLYQPKIYYDIENFNINNKNIKEEKK